MAISVTWNTVFTSGMTPTHTQFETLKTDIENASATIASDSITPAMLSAPQAYYTIVVPCMRDSDALGTGNIATASPGLGNNHNPVDFPFSVPVNSTLLGVQTSCVTAVAAGAARNNDASVRQNSSTLSATTTVFTTGVVVKTTSLSISLATTDTLLIRCNTDSAATDGVSGAFVTLYLRAAHVSD